MDRMIEQRILEIQKNIQDSKVNKDQQVTMVAVSKTVDADTIRETYSYGIRDFGENRVPVLEEKMELLKDLDIRWHFIGHLQRNKAKKIVGKVELIHAIDSLRLVETIDEICRKKDCRQAGLLQVNIGSDPKKHGFTRAEVLDVLDRIETYPNIEIQGLMTILPYGKPANENQKWFQALADLLSEVRKHPAAANWKDLSMGMSMDYKEAIGEGATIVRIGSAIFQS